MIALIIIIMMASLIGMPFMLLFLLSKCISAVKHILFYCRHISILELIHVFVCSCYRNVCLSLARCLWE